jgi:hypothetical protein
VPEPPATWHREVLPEQWTRAAADLASRDAFEGCYLAGGTGLALHIGHRRSVDLDLFREVAFQSQEFRDRLAGLQGLRNVELSSGTAYLELHGVKVSVLHYPYPLLFSPGMFDGLAVADPRDIACMKLDAIGSRGARRDFVDLYVAAQACGLPAIFEWFAAKYAAAPYNRAHLLKALTYFVDAEQEPLPDMLVPLDWSTVVQYFIREVPRLARLS